MVGLTDLAVTELETLLAVAGVAAKATDITRAKQNPLHIDPPIYPRQRVEYSILWNDAYKRFRLFRFSLSHFHGAS